MPLSSLPAVCPSPCCHKELLPTSRTLSLPLEALEWAPPERPFPLSGVLPGWTLPSVAPWSQPRHQAALGFCRPASPAGLGAPVRQAGRWVRGNTSLFSMSYEGFSPKAPYSVGTHRPLLPYLDEWRPAAPRHTPAWGPLSGLCDLRTLSAGPAGPARPTGQPLHLLPLPTPCPGPRLSIPLPVLTAPNRYRHCARHSAQTWDPVVKAMQPRSQVQT